YRRERWKAGEQTGQQWLREIRAGGYQGSPAPLYGLLGRWRTGPRHRGPYPRQQTPATLLPPPLRCSPREVSWLLLRSADDLTPFETAYVNKLLQRDQVVAITCEAVRAFFALLHNRQGDQLDAWLRPPHTS